MTIAWTHSLSGQIARSTGESTSSGTMRGPITEVRPDVGFAALTGDLHPQHVRRRLVGSRAAFGAASLTACCVLSYSIGLIADSTPSGWSRCAASTRVALQAARSRIGDDDPSRRSSARSSRWSRRSRCVGFGWTVGTVESGVVVKARVQARRAGSGSRARRRPSCAAAGGRRRPPRSRCTPTACSCDPRRIRRILVTGVVNRHSIAYAIAERGSARGGRGRCSTQLRPGAQDDRARRRRVSTRFPT